VEKYSAAMDVLDRALGPVDEWLVTHMVADWREQVWENAVRLLDMPSKEMRQERCRLIEAVAME
jgi:hypothetical protein